jgi:putative Holliday junction resolvase
VKALGLDLGGRRIGVAVSDRAGALATPWTVIERSGDERADHAALAALVAEAGADRVVVGLPLSLDGTYGPAARAVRQEAAALARALPVPVEMADERLTTVTAGRALRDTGRAARRRRKVVDQAAAAVMLQAWLDGRRGQRAVAGP